MCTELLVRPEGDRASTVSHFRTEHGTSLETPSRLEIKAGRSHGVADSPKGDSPRNGISPARGEGERVLALESREGTRASRRLAGGLLTIYDPLLVTPNPGIEPRSPALLADSLPSKP